ncbi:hypothetical protein RIF29_08406 [Crotalaria pallida]|uniref:Uncharacterized protein n=1 Tax=Crotalaria pallida TaxID=3830 RepID=A0AAN9FTL6_CROPI
MMLSPHTANDVPWQFCKIKGWIVGKEIMADTRKHCCYHILIIVCLLLNSPISNAHELFVLSSKSLPTSFSSKNYISFILFYFCKNYASKFKP